MRAAADRELWRRARSATLILGYHAFGADGEKAGRFVVPARRFARQLRWLKRRYNVITLGEYVAYRSSNRLPPPRTLVITIDDGYLDTATVAGPLLEELGLRATVFLVSDPVAETAPDADPALDDRPQIASGGARALLSETFEIGSHTRTHPRLTALDPAEARSKIAGSKQQLESALGEPVTLLAYPFGDADAETRLLAEKAGYEAAEYHQGRNRPATPPFDLRWLEICGTYSFPRFVATLLLGDLRR